MNTNFSFMSAWFPSLHNRRDSPNSLLPTAKNEAQAAVFVFREIIYFCLRYNVSVKTSNNTFESSFAKIKCRKNPFLERRYAQARLDCIKQLYILVINLIL